MVVEQEGLWCLFSTATLSFLGLVRLEEPSELRRARGGSEEGAMIAQGKKRKRKEPMS